MDAEADLEVIVEPPFTHVPPFRSEPEMAMVRDALRLLGEARRPVIVAGGGVASSQAQREVVELAERLSIPVATSLNAKGTIPDQHPLSVGVCGTYSRWCANRVVAEADLVFFIGSHTGSQVTTEWQIPRMGTPVMQLDIDPAELGRSYPIQVGLQGDARASLRKMIAAAEPPAPRTPTRGSSGVRGLSAGRSLPPSGSSVPCPIGLWCASPATAASGTTWGSWRRRCGMASTP
jgi:acetolactate synthase-1/2/3 large subunit